MDNLEFGRAVGFWSEQMTWGSLASFDAVVETWSMMSDKQRSMATDYLRGLPYERFLQTRYWYAIRLKVMSDRKDRCETCKERRTDLQVHHRTYEHHGDEHAHLEDLKLECDRCHKTIHEAAREAATLLKSAQ